MVVYMGGSKPLNLAYVRKCLGNCTGMTPAYVFLFFCPVWNVSWIVDSYFCRTGQSSVSLNE